MNLIVSHIILMLLITTSTHAQSLLHRSFEPSQIYVDITLENTALILHFSIDEEGLKSLFENIDDSKNIIETFTTSARSMTPTSSARCTYESHRFYMENNQLAGFVAYLCETPKKLDKISTQLFEKLTTLKQLNAWIYTDSRNTKAIINRNDLFIEISQ